MRKWSGWQRVLAGCAVWSLTAAAAQAAEWRFDAAPNRVKDEAVQGSLKLGDGDDAGVLRWATATGVSFIQLDGGAPGVAKTAGGSCSFELRYEFPFPVEEFQLTTPSLRGLDFGAGGCRFEYALGEEGEFQPLVEWNASTPGYQQGGGLPSKELAAIEVPEAEQRRMLRFRVVFDGFVGTLDLGDGGTLAYRLRPDRRGEVALKLYPDATDEGKIWCAETPFRFTCAADAVERVGITDFGRGRACPDAKLTRMGDRWWGELPELEPGVYELVFDQTGKEPFVWRFVLAPPARALNWEQMRRSPFGIVGISRRNGYGESAKLDGPAIAQLIGVHQERGGTGSWVDVEPVRGEFRFPADRDAILERMAKDGIVYRNTLSWTPDWAVDHDRVKPGEWSGHYPPRDEFFADYAEFCRRDAAFYQGRNAAEFEIWNEPNNEPYGSFKGTFDEFVRLCRTAAEAVHSVDPSARMILGTTGDADIGYIARLLKSGLSKEYAIVDIHPYRHTSQGPEDGLLGDIYRLKRAIAEYGDNQSIVFTEVGWPTTRIDTAGYGKVSEFEQACFNTRTLLISLAAGVERVHFHMMEDWGRDPDNPEFHFGFFKLDGSPKAAVSAMAATARQLEGAQFLGRLDTPELVHAWYWKTPWAPDSVLATVWADTQAKPDPGVVGLPGEASAAYDMWGGKAGADRVRVENGRTRVLPGADPLFIYLPASSLPVLHELPSDLRPWLRQRAEAPIADTKAAPDYGKLRYRMVAGQESKSMGFAGIGGTAALESADGAEAEPVSTFDLRYDDDALQLAFDIRSGRPAQNDRSGWWLWAGDCIRLYLGTGKQGFMTDRDYQICLAPVSADGKPAASVINYDTVSGLSAGDALPAELTVENNQDGWRLCARIAWDTLGIRPQPGDVWGFDVSAPGGSWNNPGSDNWQNPSRWGEVEFGKL